MNAMVLSAPRPVESTPLRRQEMAIPEPQAGEILLRVRCCGVCHTDLHIVEGEMPPARLPLVPGHQVVAVVERLGPGLTHPAPGSRVGAAGRDAAAGVWPNTCGRGGSAHLTRRPLVNWTPRWCLPRRALWRSRRCAGCDAAAWW